MDCLCLRGRLWDCPSKINAQTSSGTFPLKSFSPTPRERVRNSGLFLDDELDVDRDEGFPGEAGGGEIGCDPDVDPEQAGSEPGDGKNIA
jgi:hypothetical protein